MAIDLIAIRKKMEELAGKKDNRSKGIDFWKPEIGEYRVRCLPWNSPEAQPFLERSFYYLEGQPQVLAPSQFNKPDPIAELRVKLYQSGKPEDKEMAKKLQSKMRAYVPVIVRGEEDKGVKIWSFGKLIYQRLLSFFLDEDYGDITDVENGFELKVTIEKVKGKQYNDTIVDCKSKKRLSNNPEEVKKWTESVPDLANYYQLKSYDEVSKILEAWLNGTPTNDTNTDGTEKTPSNNSVTLDELEKELNPSVSTEIGNLLDDAFSSLMDEE
jgi:hypothetical protein